MGNYIQPVPQTLGPVFSLYKAHCSAPRNETDVSVVTAIRTHHPESLVTTVNTDRVDIVGYASAGHATVRLVWEGENYISTRSYKAPKTRLEKGQGTLGDKVQFGLYALECHGQQYEFYVATWRNMFEGPKRHSYILSPKQNVDSDGHDPEVDQMIKTIGKWTSELHNEIYVFDDGDWEKSSKLWEAVQSANWDDVIIDANMKQTLIQDVHSFFDSQDLFREYAVPWKRGIIMHGTPGCGKTISIKALMNSLDKRDPPVASLYVKSFDCCAGEQFSIRQIFNRARDMAPCLLIFEDLDSLIKNKVRSYFLNEVDGLENNDGILMIGSTNHLERLDPGISKRPSRFDRKYHYRLPNESERIRYCEYWKKKLERNSNIDFNSDVPAIIAKMTEGFSYAYLKELFVQTLLALASGRVDDTDESEAEKGELEGVDPDGNPHRLNAIEIPDHLKDNKLLWILRKQLVALWKDMDSSEEPEKKDEKPEEAGDEDKDGQDDENPDGEGEEETKLQSQDYRRQMKLLMKERADHA